MLTKDEMRGVMRDGSDSLMGDGASLNFDIDKFVVRLNVDIDRNC